eukprot:GHUV01034822.1.p2 GENE.GHUV01034822.1~~GHUV01034822.1.p2  ORF type:complete len:108 (+),score=12.07 GHUV01034822.1:636-959(+)
MNPRYCWKKIVNVRNPTRPAALQSREHAHTNQRQAQWSLYNCCSCPGVVGLFALGSSTSTYSHQRTGAVPTFMRLRSTSRLWFSSEVPVGASHNVYHKPQALLFSPP